MLNDRMDERIQVFEAVQRPVGSGTAMRWHRKFIYNKDLFERGGIYANVRAMTNKEIVNGGLEIKEENIKFIVNRRKEITKDCKVIYRGKVYDISTVDETDFRSNTISFTAISAGEISYKGKDIFADDEDE